MSVENVDSVWTVHCSFSCSSAGPCVVLRCGCGVQVGFHAIVLFSHSVLNPSCVTAALELRLSFSLVFLLKDFKVLRLLLSGFVFALSTENIPRSCSAPPEGPRVGVCLKPPAAT